MIQDMKGGGWNVRRMKRKGYRLRAIRREIENKEKGKNRAGRTYERNYCEGGNKRHIY